MTAPQLSVTAVLCFSAGAEQSPAGQLGGGPSPRRRPVSVPGTAGRSSGGPAVPAAAGGGLPVRDAHCDTGEAARRVIIIHLLEIRDYCWSGDLVPLSTERIFGLPKLSVWIDV